MIIDLNSFILFALAICTLDNTDKHQYNLVEPEELKDIEHREK